MINIYRLKRQHSEIKEVIAAVMTLIDGSDVKESAASIPAVLDDVSGLIGSHLRLEDQEVYPILIESTALEIRQTAQQFHDNMGGLAEEFQDYLGRYKKPSDVTTNILRFRYESRRIFERIRYRMQREESDLYPLLTNPETAETQVN
jgi:hemerythrin-like domain-containing protein